MQTLLKYLKGFTGHFHVILKEQKNSYNSNFFIFMHEGSVFRGSPAHLMTVGWTLSANSFSLPSICEHLLDIFENWLIPVIAIT